MPSTSVLVSPPTFCWLVPPRSKFTTENRVIAWLASHSLIGPSMLRLGPSKRFRKSTTSWCVGGQLIPVAPVAPKPPPPPGWGGPVGVVIEVAIILAPFRFSYQLLSSRREPARPARCLEF